MNNHTARPRRPRDLRSGPASAHVASLAFSSDPGEVAIARDWLVEHDYDLAAAEWRAALMRKEARREGYLPDRPSPKPIDPSLRPARPGDPELRDAANRCGEALDAHAEAEELEAAGDPEAPQARLRADALEAQVFAPPSRSFDREVKKITRARLRAEGDRCRPGQRVVVQPEAQRTARRSGTSSSSSDSDDADCEGEPEPPFVWPARFEQPDWRCAAPGCKDRREPESPWCWTCRADRLNAEREAVLDDCWRVTGEVA